MPVSPSAPDALSALLAQPPADAIPAALRRALLDVEGDPFAGAVDPPGVLVDTMALLAQLGADGEVAAAAILQALPVVRARLGERLEREFPRVAALLEGPVSYTHLTLPTN